MHFCTFWNTFSCEEENERQISRAQYVRYFSLYPLARSLEAESCSSVFNVFHVQLKCEKYVQGKIYIYFYRLFMIRV